MGRTMMPAAPITLAAGEDGVPLGALGLLSHRRDLQIDRRLPANLEYRIWCVDGPGWHDFDCISLLDGDERKRLSLLPPAKRDIYARHHATMRVALAQRTEIAPAALEIARGPFGKPYLPARPGLHFSLSHSRSIGGLAISDFAVGLDIEQIVESAYREVARRFCPFEFAQLRDTHDERLDNLAAARLWTGKEALAKATGRGLTGSLDNFRLGIDRDGRATELINAAGERGPATCVFLALPEPAGRSFVGTVAVLPGSRC